MRQIHPTNPDPKVCPQCGNAFFPLGGTVDDRELFRIKTYCSVSCAGKARQTTADVAVRRFWERVDKRGDDECWEWQRARQTAGYGAMTVNYKVLAMHRYSWELHNGPIPHGAHVLHKCDNPPCCNPKHLFLGTHAENMKDMANKKRATKVGRKGEAHHMSKLTEADVREIRASDVPARLAAIGYGVTATTIYMVRNRLIWKHVE